MPRQVDYYFSLQSPWAHIGHQLFREVASSYDLKVNRKPRRREVFWGQDRIELLADALKSGRAPYRSQV